MILKVFAIYDEKAGFYSAPFMFASRGEAIRAFSESANDPGQQICRWAADFTLFQVAQYDNITGLHDSDQAHVANLGKAIEYKSSDEPKLREVK